MPPFTVLHIPHSADVIPDDVRRSFVVSERQLAHERLVSTDWYTDELFALPASEAASIRFPVSRLVLDPERFVDDAQEPMARMGRGVIYTHRADGGVLRDPPAPGARAELLDRYYRPHHGTLAAAVSAASVAHGACLLIDCHSFPARPLSCDLDQEVDRPDICLGTDPVHTPPWLLERARRHFEDAGLTVAIDRPYAGVLVPETHTGGNAAILALMVEINRRLYMDESTGAKRDEFAVVATLIKEGLVELGRSVTTQAARSRT